MNKEELLILASKLQQPSNETAREFEEKREQLVAEMNRIMLQRSDLIQLIGKDNTDMMEDNHRNHGRFMSSVFTEYQPEVLVETVLWVFRAYRSHGFNLTYWPAQLDQWIELFKIHLSENCYNEIYPFYNWLLINQPAFVKLSDEVILGEAIPSHGK